MWLTPVAISPSTVHCTWRPTEGWSKIGRRQPVERSAQRLEQRQVAPLLRRKRCGFGNPVDPRCGDTGVRVLREEIEQRLEGLSRTGQVAARNTERGQALVDDVANGLASVVGTPGGRLPSGFLAS